jgi:hypothetical protein
VHPLYDIGILGDNVPDLEQAILEQLTRVLASFRLTIGKEVAWRAHPSLFHPDPQSSSVVVFLGSQPQHTVGLDSVLRAGIPVLPVASRSANVQREIPEALLPLNALCLESDGRDRLTSAILEMIGLLPRQRRVFLSYKRSEARQAALQLFDELSSKVFDVFLDTNDIAPGEDFQAVLWNRLCDSDVLVMLDTPNYFSSRWTSAEYGRALAKNIAVLRIEWPDSTPSTRTATASRVELVTAELDPTTGALHPQALDRICKQLEEVRSKGHAVRHLSMVSTVREAIQRIGGDISGIGRRSSVHLTLPDGRTIRAFLTTGVPGSQTLHDALTESPSGKPAIVYDHIGLHPDWLRHLDWLGEVVTEARWVKSSEVAWDLADWR